MSCFCRTTCLLLSSIVFVHAIWAEQDQFFVYQFETAKEYNSAKLFLPPAENAPGKAVPALLRCLADGAVAEGNARKCILVSPIFSTSELIPVLLLENDEEREFFPIALVSEVALPFEKLSKIDIRNRFEEYFASPLLQAGEEMEVSAELQGDERFQSALLEMKKLNEQLEQEYAFEADLVLKKKLVDRALFEAKTASEPSAFRRRENELRKHLAALARQQGERPEEIAQSDESATSLSEDPRYADLVELRRYREGLEQRVRMQDAASQQEGQGVRWGQERVEQPLERGGVDDYLQ